MSAVDEPARLSPQEQEFLLGERHLGRLATIGPRGMPHVVPTGWSYNPATGTFEIAGRDLAATAKFRNVARHGYAALVVDDVLPPWRPRCVLVRGRASADAPTAGEARIRITPTSVVSWGLDATPATRPAAVVERYLALVGDGRWEELAELYTEDAVVEHPLDPGAPPLRGRAAVAEHFARLRGWGLRMRATDVVVHTTADPEKVVAEFTYRGATGDGSPVERRCVFVTTVRDGLIASSRDYQADVTAQAGP